MSQTTFTAKEILQLAIGYGEGNVNFHMLYILLQILINNIDGLDACRIEIPSTLDSSFCKVKEKNEIDDSSLVRTEFMVGKDDEMKIIEKPTQSSSYQNEFDKLIVNASHNKLNAFDTNSLKNFPTPTNTETRSNTSMATKEQEFENANSEFLISNENNVDSIQFEYQSENKSDKDFMELENEIKKLTNTVNELSRNLNSLESTVATLTKGSELGQIKRKLDDLEKFCIGKSELKQSTEQKHYNESENKIERQSNVTEANNSCTSRVSALSKLDILVQEVTKLKNDFKEMKQSPTPNTEKQPIDESRLDKIEAKLSAFEKLFESLELDNQKPKSETHSSTKINEGLDEVQLSINTIKSELEKLGDLSGFLLSEKDAVAQQLTQISNQIESIKEDKANKDDVREALSEKADYSAIQNKVSHERFDAIKRDIKQSIHETIQSLTDKEAAWTQTIEDVQKLLGSKVDESDLLPLKSYMKIQVEQLQAQLKDLQKIKDENEAAGTHSKLLKDVNCISCNADAMMRRMEACHGIPKHEKWHPVISLKPYLNCKSDAVKTDVCDNTHKIYGYKPFNGIHYPHYLCNRYCGGSHTKFSVYDRVAKRAYTKHYCH